jgi:hypothetical protein
MNNFMLLYMECAVLKGTNDVQVELGRMWKEAVMT